MCTILKCLKKESQGLTIVYTTNDCIGFCKTEGFEYYSLLKLDLVKNALFLDRVFVFLLVLKDESALKTSINLLYYFHELAIFS